MSCSTGREVLGSSRARVIRKERRLGSIKALLSSIKNNSFEPVVRSWPATAVIIEVATGSGPQNRPVVWTGNQRDRINANDPLLPVTLQPFKAKELGWILHQTVESTFAVRRAAAMPNS